MAFISLNSNVIQHSDALPKDSVTLDIFESLPSTNDYLKALKALDTSKIHVCLAEQQTRGRGRLNREWHSPKGKNIYFSALMPIKKNLHELGALSLMVGLAVIKTLQSFEIHPLKIKWPNDILLNNQKLAGILLESYHASKNLTTMIIGIGINVNMAINDNPDISQAWTSLYEHTQTYFDRNAIIRVLLKNLIDYIQIFETHGMEYFMKEWMSLDHLLNKSITLNHMGETISGTYAGIDSNGQILVKIEDKIHAFSSGDVALLK